MTTSDVDRLYNGLAELATEVRGYRQELNGRLRRLEESEAAREGGSRKLGTVGKLVVGVAAVSASIGSVIGLLIAIL
jgi:hypothetical protein